MSLPIESLTPSQVVAELDKFIVGQAAAKRAVAVALRNRFRRQQLPPAERAEILPKNILMIGPTGVGKTEIARRLAQLARAPFVKVEATKFTEVGYVGRDVDSMVRDLASAAVRLVETERIEENREEGAELAKDRLIDQIIADEEAWDRQEERAAELRADLEAGRLNDRVVSFETEEEGPSSLQVFTPQGMEEMGLDIGSLFGRGGRTTRHKVKVQDALRILTENEARRLLDAGSVQREAVYRAEQTGIIFLDEIDKIAMKGGGSGPDVSREGVQRDLLPVVEGTTVATKFGPMRTDHVLFIAAGAFHESNPDDLIPELQGRFPIRVELEPLGKSDLRRILSEPRNAIIKQYAQLLAVEGVQLEFADEALDELARLAVEVNFKFENIGARRLHTMMEALLERELFESPEAGYGTVRIDAEAVRVRLGGILGRR